MMKYLFCPYGLNQENIILTLMDSLFDKNISDIISVKSKNVFSQLQLNDDLSIVIRNQFGFFGSQNYFIDDESIKRYSRKRRNNVYFVVLRSKEKFTLIV